LAGGAVIAALGATGAACGSSPEQPPPVDELEAQLTLARHDSELATAAVVAESSTIAAALNEVASERARHALALTTEIARVAGTSTTTASQTITTIGTTPPSPAPALPPPLSDVVESLRASAASAGRLAAASSGYRAGLLGSIAASCTAAYSVTLVFGQAAP
jgi:hypothetical protein